MNKIGEGKTAIVYSDGLYAYKKFRAGYEGNLSYEMRIQNEVHDHTNLPVLKYEIEDNMLKMPYIDGVEFADRMRVERYRGWLSDFVELQKSIYAYDLLSIPDAFIEYRKRINNSCFDQFIKDQASKSLSEIPYKQALCHFDFHPLNIMYANNSYYIMDWTNAKLGNPVMDIAYTYIIFRLHIKRQANKYLRLILKETGYEREHVIEALPVMAFIILSENDMLSHEQVLIDLILKEDQIYKNKENEA